MQKQAFCFIFISSILLGIVLSATTPPYGQLSVKGNKLYGSNNKVAQLRGISLAWSNWWPQYWNAQTIHAIKCSWNSNVVRVPMAVCNGPCTNGDMSAGYLKDPTGQLNMVKTVVQAAINEGIYVVVDWHEEQAVQHQAKAIEFFGKISSLYHKYPNILYELYNEPNGPGWPQIKSYCEAVAKEIRKNDPNNVIICGTPSWDQNLLDPANNPISSVKNMMYSLHYYSGTHKQPLRETAQQALSKGLPIFVTEYGTTDAGCYGFYPDETKLWWQFDENNQLSYINWSMCDTGGCAPVKQGTPASQVGNSAYFTTEGKFVNDYMKTLKNGVKC